MLPMADYKDTTPVQIILPMYSSSNKTHGFLNQVANLVHTDPFVSLHLMLIYR